MELEALTALKQRGCFERQHFVEHALDEVVELVGVDFEGELFNQSLDQPMAELAVQ
jgi:hypothetical protein